MCIKCRKRGLAHSFCSAWFGGTISCGSSHTLCPSSPLVCAHSPVHPAPAVTWGPLLLLAIQDWSKAVVKGSGNQQVSVWGRSPGAAHWCGIALTAVPSLLCSQVKGSGGALGQTAPLRRGQLVPLPCESSPGLGSSVICRQ